VTEWPGGLAVCAWSSRDEADAARWRYGGRWSVYDHRADHEAPITRRAVVSADDGRVVGFYCVGEDARVPGLAADGAVTDLGVGMAPDLVGQGRGEAFARAVLDDVRRILPDNPLRAVIQSWNTRSLRLAHQMGFEAVGEHRVTRDGSDVGYTVLILPCQR
jgi:ribosomal-protein-alanine N-acetyltransferase